MIRTILFIINFISINNLQAQADWDYRWITDPVYTPIKEAQFWGDTGIILTYNGYVYRSTNLFNSFTVDSPFLPKLFYEGSCFINRDSGFAKCPIAKGRTVYTTDGGATWDSFPIFSQYGSYDGVLRVDPKLKFAIGFGITSPGYNQSDYNYSLDGGHTWVSKLLNQSVSKCERITQMRIINDSTVCATCNTSTTSLGDLIFIKSNDRGVTWNLKTTPTFPGVHTIMNDFVVFEDTIVIVNAYKTIVKSCNGGITFDTVLLSNFTNDQNTFYGDFISFASRDSGYVAFGSSVYRTVDGGDSWSRTSFGLVTTDHIRFIQALSGTKLVVGTEKGFLYSTNNGGGIWNDIQEKNHSQYHFTLAPNPANTELIVHLTELPHQATLQLFCIDGRAATEQQSITALTTTINIAHLPAGIYLATLQTPLKRVVKKVVKE